MKGVLLCIAGSCLVGAQLGASTWAVAGAGISLVLCGLMEAYGG